MSQEIMEMEVESTPVNVKVDNKFDQLLQDKIYDPSRLHNVTCTLQFKLTDGATIKHEFASTTKLLTVRQWLDNHRTDGDMPYRFHRPLQRTSLKESDELKSLDELQLPPRSRLILEQVASTSNQAGTNIIHQQKPGFFSRFWS